MDEEANVHSFQSKEWAPGAAQWRLGDYSKAGL